ncbi:MAG: ribosome-associated translation inhibitor RaiA [Sphingomonas sp.]|nr:MAG: ribosome-associated translation inhibitor RaiA [Sphingomonas sp.]
MDIRISGHQVETGEALKTHVQDRLQGIADKYFSRAISAEVTFGKGPHDVGFKCDIVAHVMKGLVLKGRHEAQDAHPAFDGAAEKIETQLRRYMRRLKDRHAGATAAPSKAGCASWASCRPFSTRPCITWATMSQVKA